jgi:hypothetical protein
MLELRGFRICSLDFISERTIVSNRQDACSTKSEFSCGTGILPVHKRLIENVTASEIDRQSIDSQDLVWEKVWEKVFAVSQVWVFLLFSTQTKVAGQHF